MLSPRAKTLCPALALISYSPSLMDTRVVTGVVAREGKRGGGGRGEFPFLTGLGEGGLGEKCFSHGGEEMRAE